MAPTSDSQAFRERLIALRSELEETATTTDESADVVELDQSKVGRLSRMDAMQAQAMAKASVARREMMLAKIEAALARVGLNESQVDAGRIRIPSRKKNAYLQALSEANAFPAELEDIVAMARKENIGSLRVMSKIGMRDRGINERYYGEPLAIYGVRRAEFVL